MPSFTNVSYTLILFAVKVGSHVSAHMAIDPQDSRVVNVTQLILYAQNVGFENPKWRISDLFELQ